MLKMRKTYLQLLVSLTFTCAVLGYLFNSPQWTPINDGTDELLTRQKDRKNALKSICLQRNLTKAGKAIESIVAHRLFVEHNHKFIYCEVPKVGCSNWKRILFFLQMNRSFDAAYIDHDAIHTTKILKRLSDFTPDQQRKMLDTYTKVMFTREPLQRIVSAYRDKLLHPGGYYGTGVANVIRAKVRKNKDDKSVVSFEEFVKFLVDQESRGMDIHWMPMHLLCDPCNINYDILGKMETLKSDSDDVLKVIRAPKGIKYPEIKQHSNESRTNTGISYEYLSKLPLTFLQKLLEKYALDFALFDYLH
ncbi:carbohydrate sulfotransferase 8-like isoform 1-T2 [Discoglossus pictus]